jgi:hypothetical protein
MFNGMITSKMKPRGNTNTFYDPTTPSSFHRGNYPTLARLLASIAISGRDFFLRGEGYNTPCYDSPNISLITIISSLVMHYVLELINSESSQRDFWFNLNLHHQILTNRLLVWTSNLYPWIGLDTRCKPQHLLQISSKFKVPEWNYSKFSWVLELYLPFILLYDSWLCIRL